MFDWDDTLFPSSRMCYDKDAKAQPLETSAEELHAFGKSTYFVFRKYLRVFDAQNIFIVTNAKREWVMRSLDSASKMFRLKTRNNPMKRGLDFFLALKDCLLDHDISIISAQDLHAKRYPEQPTLLSLLVFFYIFFRLCQLG